MSSIEPPPVRKKRPPPKTVVVAAVEQPTPCVVRVTFTGAELDSFALAKPAAHMKLFFPTSGAWPPPGGVEAAPRPPSRTYTPRRFDPAKSLLEIEFVLHGAGLAADWARHAKPGDSMLVSASPGGGYSIPEGVTNIIIIADDTAMPAAGTLVEALPAGCNITAICEIESAAEERPLSPRVSCQPRWLHRMPGALKPGAQLEQAVAAWPEQPAHTYWWVACEAGTMRRIRDTLVTQRGVARTHLHTRGYWKNGDTNYPDHDYGED